MTNLQKHYLAGGLIVVLALLCHGPALTGPFMLDDIPAVVEQPVVQGDVPLEEVWLQTYWGERSGYEKVAIYRPLVTLSFFVNQSLTPNSPEVFRGTNLILHALVSLLCWLLLLRFVGFMGALMGGTVFAVHPIHVDAVAAIANRTELLAALFGLAAIHGYLNYRENKQMRWFAGGLFCWGCALFSKESAIVIPPLLYLWECLPSRRWRPVAGRLRWFIIAATITVFYLGLRTLVLMDPFGGETPWQDNPLQSAAGVERWLTPFALLSLVIEMLLAPFNLSADYTFNALPLVSQWHDPRWWIGLLIGAGVLLGCWQSLKRDDSRRWLLGFLLLILPYGLVSHFLFPGTILFAERLLYLPSVGFVLLLAAWFHMSAPRLLGRCLWVSWVLLLGGLCVEYAGAWTSPQSLFERSLSSRPGSARMHTNLGHESLVSGDLDAAVSHSAMALELDETSAEANLNLGSALEGMGRLPEAVDVYRKGTTFLEGRYGLAHINLCRLGTRLDPRGDGIEESCEKGIRLRDELAASWVAHGHNQERLGRAGIAEASFREATRREPQNPLVFHELAGYFDRLKKPLERWNAMVRILELAPEEAALRTAVVAEGMRLAGQARKSGDIHLETTLKGILSRLSGASADGLEQ